MKTFKASQELAEILLANGFNETTKKDYPIHFKKMKNGYNPESTKRKFSFHSHKDYILFDYINIYAFHNHGCNGKESRTIISSDELKSIISFYKLSSNDKYKWSVLYDDIFLLYNHILKMINSPKWYNFKFDNRLKSTFEKVKI